ncbi:ATP-binding cassette domain-containing protein [Algoriphagus aestuariicola]|uniref:ATP-binding cassette domain-containing protein n=1 Tax=Algoriphagus aestuariicola TaxID=1852016 RepID=A0ABS3BQF5_9BACT|nr:ATP-binding cassette domain-containing protein [Algoriphagus aestuariicola]MBN7801520.1 ATP-binding cassette domain-containing protein [Algoriphagus aestuariicola]
MHSKTINLPYLSLSPKITATTFTGMDLLLSLTAFSKEYPSGFKLSIEGLKLKPGIHLIGGENGSGKSTFLKAIAGIHDSKGEIELTGISLRKTPLSYRMKIGYAEAEPVFPEFLSADNLISVVASAKQAGSPQINLLKTTLGIVSFSSHPVGTYSSGMLKKTALVLAFMGDPSLIILDEPFTTIDRKSQETLTDLIIEKAKSGVSFLLTTHQSQPLDHLPIDTKLLFENGCLL